MTYGAPIHYSNKPISNVPNAQVKIKGSEFYVKYGDQKNDYSVPRDKFEHADTAPKTGAKIVGSKLIRTPEAPPDYSNALSTRRKANTTTTTTTMNDDGEPVSTTRSVPEDHTRIIASKYHWVEEPSVRRAEVPEATMGRFGPGSNVSSKIVSSKLIKKIGDGVEPDYEGNSLSLGGSSDKGGPKEPVTKIVASKYRRSLEPADSKSKQGLPKLVNATKPKIESSTYRRVEDNEDYSKGMHYHEAPASKTKINASRYEQEPDPEGFTPKPKLSHNDTTSPGRFYTEEAIKKGEKEPINPYVTGQVLITPRTDIGGPKASVPRDIEHREATPGLYGGEGALSQELGTDDFGKELTTHFLSNRPRSRGHAQPYIRPERALPITDKKEGLTSVSLFYDKPAQDYTIGEGTS